MKGITVRFGDQLYRTIREEAAREGITISTYIRETVVARVYVARAQRGMYSKEPRTQQGDP